MIFNFLQIVIITAALVSVNAQNHGQSHGHAVSSQSIIRHDISHDQHNSHHIQAVPIVQQAAPIVHHGAPIVHHVAPVVHHAAPVVHHAPVYHSQQHDSHDHQDYYVSSYLFYR